MMRRLLKFAKAVIVAAVMVTYLPTIESVSSERGTIFMAPVWFCAATGFVVLIIWLEDLLHKQEEAPAELHNAYFPTPAVRANGWTDYLSANDATISAAISAARSEESGMLGLVSATHDELILTHATKGWRLSIHRFDKPQRLIAVQNSSEWANAEIEAKGWSRFFKKFPSDFLDDEQVLQIARHFVGLTDEPANVSWATIRYTI